MRVMRPRMTVPTSGRRREAAGRATEIVGSLMGLEVEGVLVMGPARLAKRLLPAMCVPAPTLAVAVAPRSWPGRAIDGDDMSSGDMGNVALLHAIQEVCMEMVDECGVWLSLLARVAPPPQVASPQHTE